MRRKFLSVVLCACMMLTMAPFAFATDGEASSSEGNGSSTSNTVTNAQELRNAIDTATGNTTITVSGTIEISAPIDIDDTITITGTDNAEIKASSVFSGGYLIGLKTADKTLTLGNIKLDANKKSRVVYCNAGKVVVNGATITGGETASSYIGGVYMTSNSEFEMNSGSITGNSVSSSYANDGYLQYSADLWIGANANGVLPKINGGTIGNVFVNANEYSATNPGGFTMSNGTITNLYVEYDRTKNYGASFTYNDGSITNLYVGTKEGNDTKVKIDNPIAGMTYKGGQTSDDVLTPVAQVGTTTYGTLEAAIAAAQPGVATTITMLKDVNLPNYITVNNGKDITLDLNKHNIIFTGYSVFRVKGANFHVTGEGTIFENQKDGFAPIIAGGSKEDIANYTTITIDKDVILKGDYAGIFVDTDNGGKGSYNNYGLIINMNGSIDLTAITDGVSAYGIYVQGLNKVTTGNVMQINLDGARIKTGEEAIYAAGYAKWNLKDCTFTAENAAIELRAGEMTIDGGNYTATATEFKCEANGNGSTTQGAALAIAQHTTKKDITVNIKDGTFVGVKALNESNPQENDPSPQVNLSISNGKFKGEVTTADVTKFISGGYFTTDPSAYCVDGKTGIPSTEPGYAFTVGEKANTEVKPATGAPDVTVPDTIDNTKNNVAKAVGESVTDSTGALSAAANQAISNVTEAQKTDAENAIRAANSGVTVNAGDTVNIYAQTYLKVTPTAYEDNRFTLDIQPMYRVVASTKGDGENFIFPATDVNNANAIVLTGSEKPLTNIQTMEISLELPNGFATVENAGYKPVYVQHKGHEYIAAVTDKQISSQGATTTTKQVATFTNPDGFSEFTISKAPVAVATIGQNRYTTLQDAVDAAANGATIVLNSGTSHTLNLNTTKSVTVKNNTGDKATITFNGTAKEIATNGEETFTYTRPSSGGPSSSGGSISTPTTYAVNVNAATNGAVAADKKTASKGTTVTVTASPSKGYVVDAVKVVDKDGKDVAVTGKDGKYVFTMPGSAVTVTGTFKAETPAPVALPFTDVKSGNWFYDAVKYAYEQGLMTGTSATTFAPNGTMNRAMIVTVLYRLEKSPAVTSASKFTDVPAGQWYSDAVAWAAANKIVNGYDETTFGPMNAVTREQMAAILFRYEQVKGLENVTLEENLNRFPDQNKISAYAIPALQWAVGQKIINGNADGTLDPTGTATRAQVAQIFTNLLNK